MGIENRGTENQPKSEKGRTADTTTPDRAREDAVDEVGKESFPASDSPSWSGVAAH